MAEEFLVARLGVMHDREEMTHEQAADILRTVWGRGWEARKVTWENERPEREAERNEGQDREGRERDRENAERNVDELTMRSRENSQDLEEEGPKFVAGKPVQERIEYPPARFALKKLKEREYIELCYFTPELRNEAAKSESVSSNDIFTLTQEDNMLSLKPASNFKAKTKVVQDEDLTWDQMSIASIDFLEHIIQEKWPKSMVDAMHTFFFRLTHHRLRTEGVTGSKVLLLYQARVRREWHRQIKNPPRDGIFDVGLIDERLLRTIKDEVFEQRREASLAGK
ncbi:hypothetical protein C0992_004681 [Termitomyces sp. T32_za158]|nr:hypothetical protein C0992_004681 [Termitomyces sp. T32_za158]